MLGRYIISAEALSTRKRDQIKPTRPCLSFMSGKGGREGRIEGSLGHHSGLPLTLPSFSYALVSSILFHYLSSTAVYVSLTCTLCLSFLFSSFPTLSFLPSSFLFFQQLISLIPFLQSINLPFFFLLHTFESRLLPFFHIFFFLSSSN